ncbi:hypothetical protein [Cerasicoccus fimbriatus]|uniref:hypothetical protein n=1 Tax=Cerasicoccus fimbriatus TaxID=3014554 RepID=UPI0022B48DF7|nr:hypothetical protein [Cerasicoccus sp. TK19100]
MKHNHTTTVRRLKMLIIAGGISLGMWLFSGCSSTSTHASGSTHMSASTGAPSGDGQFHMRPCTYQSVE